MVLRPTKGDEDPPNRDRQGASASPAQRRSLTPSRDREGAIRVPKAPTLPYYGASASPTSVAASHRTATVRERSGCRKPRRSLTTERPRHRPASQPHTEPRP